ncbi:MAG: hypothetical protein H7062_20640 [Candidatus Saccharimonas sp.]|nr:hypothetical protein [Planctomycetaceae bacterium]
MSSLRYKTLLSYLPGMASVVNTFESPQVQNSVYETLMEALEGKLQAEGIGAQTGLPKPRDLKRFNSPAATPIPGGEVAHDLIEGDSIHGDSVRSSIAPSTVF